MADYLPPKTLQVPLEVPSKLLMGPGPSNCPANILKASAQPMLGHLDGDFLKIMDDVKMGIQYAFQTKNRMTFAVSGTGMCAMETAIINLLESGDIFLIASPGIWGDRAQNIAENIGAKCFKIRNQPNCAIDLELLEEIVERIQPKVIFLCHGDSSTGVVQPLDGISDILNRYDTLFLVDSVASLGAAPLCMDKLGIDVLYAGSQKILNAPPGLSPISFSDKAVNRIKARKTPIPSFYLNCLLIGNYWKCDDDLVTYHHTAPISLVYALREGLAILAQETLEKSWIKHKKCAEMLYKQLEDMGLTMFVDEKAHRLPSVTAVNIPKHVDGSKVIELMKKRFCIEIAGGLGTTAGKVWRIGLMGYNCSAENVTKIVHALNFCINLSSMRNKL